MTLIAQKGLESHFLVLFLPSQILVSCLNLLCDIFDLLDTFFPLLLLFHLVLNVSWPVSLMDVIRVLSLVSQKLAQYHHPPMATLLTKEFVAFGATVVNLAKRKLVSAVSAFWVWFPEILIPE